jgi:hypothetical protein
MFNVNRAEFHIYIYIYIYIRVRRGRDRMVACLLVLVKNIGLSKIMVFNATFNNISVISFRTVLMAEKRDSNSQLKL